MIELHVKDASFILTCCSTCVQYLRVIISRLLIFVPFPPTLFVCLCSSTLNWTVVLSSGTEMQSEFQTQTGERKG